MKKIILLMTGLLIIAGNAMAGCGTCEATEKAHKHADEKKKEAACEMKAAEKKTACKVEEAACKLKESEKEGTCTVEKAECEAKKAECGAKKAECKAGKKACKAEADIKDNASEKAQEKRKKWWKFWGGE